MEQTKERKWLFIVLIILLILSCGGLVYNVLAHNSKEKNKFFDFFNNTFNSNIDNAEDIVDSAKESIKTSQFNFDFINESGKQRKSSVEELLDNVINSNNKNQDKKIEVVFEEETTSDTTKIKEIRNRITNLFTEEFDITLGYDEKGYINKITIDKMDISVNDFNFQFFIHKHSSQMGVSVKRTLDAVIDSNRKYENHQITVSIEGINSNDGSAITNVKNSIDDYTNYNVNYGYDQTGYINQITFQR